MADLASIYRAGASNKQTIGNITVEIFNPSDDAIDKAGVRYLEKLNGAAERFSRSSEKILRDHIFIPPVDVRDPSAASEDMINITRKTALEKLLKEDAKVHGKTMPTVYVIGERMDREKIRTPEFAEEMKKYAEEQGIKGPLRIVFFGENANEIWGNGIKSQTGANPSYDTMFLFTSKGKVVGFTTDKTSDADALQDKLYRESFAPYDHGRGYTGPPPKQQHTLQEVKPYEGDAAPQVTTPAQALKPPAP